MLVPSPAVVPVLPLRKFLFMKFIKINWRYALGELLIVIAGITIAFMVNNWAERRADKEQALLYLQNLQSDLEADMLSLNNNLDKLQNTATAIENYIPHLFQTLPGRDTVPGVLFRKIHDYVYFFPHDATYRSMLHSGDFKLIPDFSLKNRIVEHYSSYNKLFKELDRYEHFAKNYTADYFMHKTDHVRLFQNQQASILDDPFLKNLVFSSKGIFSMQIHAHENALERCEALHAELKTQISKMR